MVEDVLGDAQGHFALVVKNLEDGTGYTLARDRSFYSASIYKVWVMVEAFHQRDVAVLDWNEEFVVSRYYADLGLNPGEFQECDVVTVFESLSRMMGRTDNVAANLLLERVGSGNINRSLRSLGLNTSGFYGDNTLPTTANEMALLLEAIYEGEVVDGGVSDEMLTLMRSESIDDRIPRLLPAGTDVAHKTGNWSNATHDAGIVFSPGATYLLVVLADYGYADNGADLIAALSKAVYDYYNRA